MVSSISLTFVKLTSCHTFVISSRVGLRAKCSLSLFGLGTLPAIHFSVDDCAIRSLSRKSFLTSGEENWTWVCVLSCHIVAGMPAFARIHWSMNVSSWSRQVGPSLSDLNEIVERLRWPSRRAFSLMASSRILTVLFVLDSCSMFAAF